MARTRRYILRAIFQSMTRGEWYISRDLVSDVSEKVGKDVNYRSISQHLRRLEEKGLVESDRFDEYRNCWRRTGNASI